MTSRLRSGLSRRDMIQRSTLALCAAATPSIRLQAQAISPVMATLSSYMAAAKDRALAILNNSQHEFVKCQGTTVGLPDLRAGKHVEILNIGSRFSGRYFLTETEHIINGAGYITKFKAQRDDPGRVR